MRGGMLMVLIGSVSRVGGTFLASVEDEPSTMKYEADEELPKDFEGERRRDHAVLEAVFNDLASPNNPEYRFQIENQGGPSREIVVNRTLRAGPWHVDAEYESRDIIDGDPQRIPVELQEALNRRALRRARSLKSFKPANPNILVRDLDALFQRESDPVDAFLKTYPTAWGYVWASHPGYSRDGKLAFVHLGGGPNGIHGLYWEYMLARDKKRWVILWRHCHPHE